MKCVTTASYFVLVNGQPIKIIRPTRGIHQGDPISPYLFLIFAEELSNLLNNAESTKKIYGVKIAREGPSINHLLFANDSLPFCRATIGEWQEIHKILVQYEDAFGQSLNKQKTSIIFNKNTDSLVRNHILHSAGVFECQNQDTYLGLPYVIRRS